jgi:hypothetical protein
MLHIHAISISSTSNGVPVYIWTMAFLSQRLFTWSCMPWWLAWLVPFLFMQGWWLEQGFRFVRTPTPERHDGLQVLHDSLNHVKLTRPPKTLPSRMKSYDRQANDVCFSTFSYKSCKIKNDENKVFFALRVLLTFHPREKLSKNCIMSRRIHWHGCDQHVCLRNILSFVGVVAD